MKTKFVALLAVCMLCATAQADPIVNGDFSSGWAGQAWEELSGTEGGDGTPIDDGWIVYKGGGNHWDVTGGAAVRNSSYAGGQEGFGQIATNPGGDYDNGKTVTFKFDYDFDGGPLGLDYRLYGIAHIPGHTGAWNRYDPMLDRLSLRAPDNGDIGVDDTTWYNGFAIYELDAGNISTVSAATYSADISLTRQYGYFGLVFTSDIGTGTGVSVDNVALVPVPEPATMGLLGLGMLGLVLRRKKK